MRPIRNPSLVRVGCTAAPCPHAQDFRKGGYGPRGFFGFWGPQASRPKAWQPACERAKVRLVMNVPGVGHGRGSPVPVGLPAFADEWFEPMGRG